MERFVNKNVFLTGAASGIGKATARRLANEGAKLIIADVNQKLLDETSKELKDSVLETYTLDISNVSDIAKIFEEVKSRFKTLQALVNVAGILRFDHSKDVELKDWQKILDVNLTGTFFMCRYALPFIIESNDYFGLYNRSKHNINSKITISSKNNFQIYFKSKYRSRYGLMDNNGNDILDNYDQFVNPFIISDLSISKKIKNYTFTLGSDNLFDYSDPQNLPNNPGRIVYSKIIISI